MNPVERKREVDRLARLAFFLMLEDDQLLDEMLLHPAGSTRYQAALNELQRRALEKETE